jgi:hypothetical protein
MDTQVKPPKWIPIPSWLKSMLFGQQKGDNFEVNETKSQDQYPWLVLHLN